MSNPNVPYDPNHLGAADADLVVSGLRALVSARHGLPSAKSHFDTLADASASPAFGLHNQAERTAAMEAGVGTLSGNGHDAQASGRNALHYTRLQ